MSRFRVQVGFTAVVSIVSLSMAVALGQTASPSSPLAPLHPSDGATLFRDKGCPQCHMIRGVGGSRGPDLSGVGRRLKKDGIRNQIVLGGGAMPAYGDAMQSDEVTLLVRYLQTCRAKSPKRDKNVPTTPAAPPDAPSE